VFSLKMITLALKINPRMLNKYYLAFGTNAPKEVKIIIIFTARKGKVFFYIFDFHWVHLVIKASLILPKLTQKYQV
jgi:hypothetical protein